MQQEPVKSSCAAFILAGGKSTRMGTDKAFVLLNGRTLLEHMLNVARMITANVTIVGAASKFQQFAPTVEDVFPNCGPLGGIHAALRASSFDLNLMLAVDVPFVSSGLLNYLLGCAQSDSATVIVPRTSQGWQPLCAIYRREFANLAEAALRTGSYKIDALFDRIKVHQIDLVEMEEQGFSPQMFRNLNTREELTAAAGWPATATRHGRDSTTQ